MASDDASLRSLSLDYLNLLINGQAFSDVTFTVEGRLIHAHRCVLAARSPFFRRFFCGPEDPPGVVHVNSVSYEVFMLVLQYLYSGHASVVPQRLEPGATCGDRACCHANCAAAFDLALETLSASRSFGVEQLALITQKQLEKMVEKASIEDVMKVLIASSNQDSSSNQLWLTCSHLVANSGLPPQTLAKHLPPDIVARIENLRLKSSLPRLLHHHHHHPTGGIDEKLHRMRRALDSADIELVRLMVMADGLDLDRSLALHYAVENCSREVVKALLELGLVDVNLPVGPTGQTPLHVAAEMVSPEMVAVLLDHHADPTRRAADGASPLDVLRALTSEFLLRGAGGGGRAAGLEPNKLRLCLELVQSAALVISREEERGGGEAWGRSIYSRGHK